MHKFSNAINKTKRKKNRIINAHIKLCIHMIYIHRQTRSPVTNIYDRKWKNKKKIVVFGTQIVQFEEQFPTKQQWFIFSLLYGYFSFFDLCLNILRISVAQYIISYYSFSTKCVCDLMETNRVLLLFFLFPFPVWAPTNIK